MARPTTHEFSLLKLLATSTIFLIEEMHNAKVELCLPYLVEHNSYKKPDILWLPDLDYPFSTYVSGDNKTLWQKFHDAGRQRNEDISIWSFVSEVEKIPLEGQKTIHVEIKQGGTLKQAQAGEFTVMDLQKKTIVLATARQSCGTLISVISFMFSACFVDNQQKLKDSIEKYLEHIGKSRYLMLFKDLNLPSINVATWTAMRKKEGANHWGDEGGVGFVTFTCCTEDWCRQLRSDFSGDFSESNRTDESRGRPALLDILSRDTAKGRIQRVIECRVRSLIGKNSRVTWMVGAEVGDHDYLWFNALAIADCFAAAIKGYGELLSATDRVLISDYYKAHPFVILHLSLSNLSENKYDLNVHIYEPGLIGSAVKENTGCSLQRVIIPAINAGAREVMLIVSGKYYRVAQLQGANVKYEVVEVTNPTNLPFSGFTGFVFNIHGKLCKRQLIPEV